MEKNELKDRVNVCLNMATDLIGDEIEIIKGWTIINDYNDIIHLYNESGYEWAWDFKEIWRNAVDLITDYITR